MSQVRYTAPMSSFGRIARPRLHPAALQGGLGELPGISKSLYGFLSLASSAVSTYHGYKRNDSVGWAIAWGLLGAAFPVITPAVAVAQGLGKRKRS